MQKYRGSRRVVYFDCSAAARGGMTDSISNIQSAETFSKLRLGRVIKIEPQCGTSRPGNTLLGN